MSEIEKIHAAIQYFRSINAWYMAELFEKLLEGQVK